MGVKKKFGLGVVAVVTPLVVLAGFAIGASVRRRMPADHRVY